MRQKFADSHALFQTLTTAPVEQKEYLPQAMQSATQKQLRWGERRRLLRILYKLADARGIRVVHWVLWWAPFAVNLG